jgi:hypothetical protein
MNAAIEMVMFAGLVALIAGLAVPGGRRARHEFGRRRSLLFIASVAVLVIAVIPGWQIARISAVLAYGGCAPTWSADSDPVFCVRGSVEGHILVISGETSLPDGSKVLVWTKDLSDATQLTVMGGVFQDRCDLSRENAGRLTVTVQFIIAQWVKVDAGLYDVGPSEQPVAVVSRYGRDGANLVGPTAEWIQGPLFLNYAPPIQVLQVGLDVLVPG